MDRTKARLVSAATLGALVIVLLLGVVWAWAAVTKPFPQAAADPVCRELDVAAGDKLRPREVVVSVLNASTREGLAGFTEQQLGERGFASGGIDNAPDEVVIGTVKIWTTDPDSPAVDLLRAYLGEETRVIERDSGQPGVTLVVGNGFAGVVDGPARITAEDAATICAPPTEAS